MIRSLSMVGVLLAVAGAGVVAGCGGGGSGGSNSVTVFVDGDTNVRDLWQKHLIPEYQKAVKGAHVKLIYAQNAGSISGMYSRLAAAAKTHQNPGVDVLASSIIQNASQANLLAKPDRKSVPNLAHVDSSLLAPLHGNAVPYRGSSVVLAYDSAAVPKPPATVDALIAWAKAHPGRFTYTVPDAGLAGTGWLQAVLDKYVPAADSAKMKLDYVPNLENSWDKGFRALKDLDGAIYRNGVYPPTDQAALDLLSHHEVDITTVWSDQGLSGKKSRQLPSTTQFGQLNPPFLGGPSYLAVPASSKHKDAAFKLVNWTLTTPAQRTVVTTIWGYPGVELRYLPADLQQQFRGLTLKVSLGYSPKMFNDASHTWHQRIP
jgi:putative spermidine/putrescine transport system substrate-binding protein